ncbi:Cof-like hydrolase family protein [Lacticaseibacillus camelliae DSM 22697 = JCM 13995]|uniref:Cof-like hydrolase family protein n=4 Tax=Lacticaseibacillus camelliae TaxID=381742 RepID=A0A0R2FB33_9LACO|nr:Cof-like hydrolase family protein [Lacticaseibacillus camelliae DSM 22697 = JCM 13995]
MDGTLLDETGRVRDSNAQKIKQSGLPLTLVSARSPKEMQEAITALDLRGPQIAYNGGMIFEPLATGRKILSALPMPTTSAKQIITDIIERFPSTSVSYYDGADWYAERMDDNLRGEIAVSRLMPTFAPYQEVFERPRRIMKIMLIDFDASVMAQIHDFFATHDFPGINARSSNAAWLEITSAEAEKSRGIKHVLETEHLDTKDVAAFGDGQNDLPMLTMVGTPIVMANAAPAIKQVAKHITKSNVEDGVGYGMLHFLKA